MYVAAVALAAAALGSATQVSPAFALSGAIFVAWAGSMISERTSSPRQETAQEPQPERRIFFDEDLPQSFFTGESERAREIASGAEWTRGPADLPSDGDADIEVLRFAMPRLYAAVRWTGDEGAREAAEARPGGTSDSCVRHEASAESRCTHHNPAITTLTKPMAAPTGPPIQRPTTAPIAARPMNSAAQITAFAVAVRQPAGAVSA